MIPLNLIFDSNIGIYAQKLLTGQEIVIPGFTTQSYRIKQGDSFWKLSTSQKYFRGCLLTLKSNHQSE